MRADWRNPFSIERLSLRTRLAPEECAARLATRLSSAWTLFPEPSRPIRGHVSAQGFRIRLAIPYRNGFQTEATGEFIRAPDGTAVTIRVGITRSATIGLIAWSAAVMAFTASALVITASERLGDLRSIGVGAAVTLLAALLLMAGLVSIGRWLARRQADSLLMLLRELLEPEETAGERSAP